MAQPALASRPGSRLAADRLNPRPGIIPDQDQPARQPDDVLPGNVPIHGPLGIIKNALAPAESDHTQITWLCTVPAAQPQHDKTARNGG